MSITSTHTYAVLRVSRQTYDEIARRLREAGYGHAFVPVTGETLIDMHGIALGRLPVVKGKLQKVDSRSKRRIH